MAARSEAESLASLLRQLDLGYYLSVFEAEQVDMKTLRGMSKADLRSISLSFGASRTIFEYLAYKSSETETMSRSFVESSTPTNVVSSPVRKAKRSLKRPGHNHPN